MLDRLGTMAAKAMRKFNPDRDAAKHGWEFEWQRTQWLELWKRPETQAKCLEYWVRFRHLDDVRAKVDIGERSDVLDVGCGLSSVLHFLPGRRVGVDPIAERYKSVYEYPGGIEVVEATGESLPFGDEAFDVVFCSNCIDHTADPARTVAEIGRVLRRGGHFVLTCEVFGNDLGRRNEGHPHSMTGDKLRGLVKDFDIVDHWVSPWYGMRSYALGEPRTDQDEHIYLLGRPR